MPLIPVTINLFIGDPVPISNARVSIWDEEYTTCLYDEYTDVNGQATVGLDVGIYRVFLQKQDISFGILPKDIELIDVPISVTYEGIAQTYPSGSNGTIYLYGDVKDLNLNPITSSKIQIYLASNPQTKSGALLDKTIMEVYTNESGRWGTLLPGGSTVTVVVLGSNFQRTGILPFTGNLNILELV